jgi:HAE1 family hydrophobic/amphiphilic exporter-1
MAKVGNRLKSISGVKDVVMVGGFSLMHGGAQLSNAGFAYVVLDDWALRGRGKELSTIMQTANAEVHAVPGAKTQVFAPPSVPGLGTTSGYSLQVMLRDGSLDIASLVRTSDELVDRLRRQPKILKAYASQGGFYPHIKVDIDRTRTQTLAVSFEDIFSTLGIYIGSDKPLQFVKFGQLYYVTVQAEGRFRALPEDIERLSVRNSDGNMVPIGAFAKVRSQIGPSVLTLFNRQLAVEVSGLPASDAASGDALASIDRVAAEVLPSQFGYEFSGISREERSAGNLEYYVFLLAIVLIYLILAALYGSWLAPFPVILSAPLAFAGTAALMLALGISNNLYTQIGTVLLIALISKNAILIVEFARLLRRRDKMDIAEAAINAAQRRFRPIVMTSLTFILGVVPMIFASGPAANAQNSIGVTVISGMLVATILTLIFVPSFFVLFQRLEETISARQTSAVAAASPPSSATR